MEIIMKKVDEIKPYEKNPRHNEEAVKYVANSIKEFGFKNPIIIDKNNVIIAGHTRLKASIYLNLESVPCIIADDLTEEQVKALRIADNKVSEMATWDEGLLELELEQITGIDMGLFGIEELEELEEEIVDDEFDVDKALDETEQEYGINIGDIYQLGKHKLMCGDSTNPEHVKKLLEGKEADLLFTDPPYNINVSNSKGDKIINDNMKDKEFYLFLESAFKNAGENLKKGGAFYIWYADTEVVNFRNALTNNELEVKQNLIWNKNTFTLGRQDYKWKHEPCLYGWKKGASHYFIDIFNIPTVLEQEPIEVDKLSKEELKKILKDILDYKYTTIICENKPRINDLHPTMKPIPMCANLISNSTNPEEIVLDLFGGSGSTLIACEQINRKAYLMEYDPKYVNVILKRYEEFTGEKPIKLN